MGSSLLALNHLNRINLTKMSETEVKTDAPTTEEIKGTKRTAEDELDVAKKQKTENGSNGAGNGAAAEENGADVEEEEDVDEEDEEALGEEEEGEGGEDLDEEAEGEEGEEEEDGGRGGRGRRRLNFLVCCHPTSSFRTTYTKYATSSSSLLYKKKGQKEIDCVSSKSTPIQTREMPDQFPTIHKTTEHPLTKRKVSQEMVFSLKQNKKESFLPPFKTKN